MLRRQYHTPVYVVFLHANAIILTDTSVYIDVNVRCPALFVMDAKPPSLFWRAYDFYDEKAEFSIV